MVFQLGEGALTVYNFITNTVALKCSSIFGVMVCVGGSGGWEGKGEMGEPINLEGFCGSGKFKQFLERIPLKGRNSAAKRVSRPFIWWTNLFQRQASGDNLLLRYPCPCTSPIPVTVLWFSSVYPPLQGFCNKPGIHLPWAREMMIVATLVFDLLIV